MTWQGRKYQMTPGGIMISDGSIYSHDCGDTLPAGWTVSQLGNSTATGTTTDEGRSTYLLKSGASDNAANLASISDLAAFTAPASPTTIIISKIVKVNRLGNQGATLDYMSGIISYSSSKVLSYQIWNDLFGIQDSTGTVNFTAWTPLYGSYFVMSFEIDYATLTCDVYINNTKIITGADCSRALSYTGRWSSAVVNRQSSGYTETIKYDDKYRVGTGWTTI